MTAEVQNYHHAAIHTLYKLKVTIVTN